jgi:hypothetical protein
LEVTVCQVKFKLELLVRHPLQDLPVAKNPPAVRVREVCRRGSNVLRTHLGRGACIPHAPRPRCVRVALVAAGLPGRELDAVVHVAEGGEVYRKP